MSTAEIHFLDLDHSPIAADYREVVGGRVAIARILAGRITAAELAATISEVAGTPWSRDKLANIETGRKRITWHDVELIAQALQSYGLEFVDVHWLLGETGSLTGDFPGYPVSVLRALARPDGGSDAA